MNLINDNRCICGTCNGTGYIDTPDELPTELDSDEFRQAWAEWLAYRRKARLKKYRQPERQLKRLASLGAARAIAAIQYSIEMEYQGIHEGKVKPVAGDIDSLFKEAGF